MIDTIGKTIDYFEGVEQALVDVVIVAMKKILVSYEDTKLVKQIVKSALQVVRNQKHITLRVHPDVKDIVQDNLGEIASSSPTIGIIEVVGDTRVDRDGCIVDCDMGIVEASLSSQLKILEEAMHSSLGKGKKPSAVTAKPVTKATSKAKPAKKPTKKAEPKTEPKEEEPKDKK